jgi:hypothetical protein
VSFFYSFCLQYALLSGTSMSTPLVAGIVASYVAQRPDLSTAAMKRILLCSATRGTVNNVPRATSASLVYSNMQRCADLLDEQEGGSNTAAGNIGIGTASGTGTGGVNSNQPVPTIVSSSTGTPGRSGSTISSTGSFGRFSSSSTASGVQPIRSSSSSTGASDSIRMSSTGVGSSNPSVPNLNDYNALTPSPLPFGLAPVPQPGNSSPRPPTSGFSPAPPGPRR